MARVEEILARAAALGPGNYVKPPLEGGSNNSYAPGASKVEQRLLEAQKARGARMGELTQRDGVRAVQQSRFGVNETTPEVERDMATLGAAALTAKYGEQGAAQMIAVRNGGQGAAFQAENTDRGTFQEVGDAALDVTRAFTNLAGGLEGMAGSAVDWATGGRTSIGPAVARTTENIDNFLKGRQSNELQERRGFNDVYGELASEDNQRWRDKQDAEGGSSFVNGLRQIGRGITNAISGSTQDGAVLGSDLINAGGSMLAVGPLSKAVRAIGGGATRGSQAAMDAAVKARVLSPFTPAINRDVTKRIGDAIATPVAIGLMEGGSGYTGAVNEIMGMSHEQLMEGSAEYREIMKENPDDLEMREAAKLDIAQTVGRGAAAVSGTVGALSGRLVRGIEGEGSLVGNAVRMGVGRASAREGLEEGIQGATQPLATNALIEAYADEDRQLAQGVGEGLGEGALLGSLSAGILATPGTAASAVGGAAKLTGKAAFKGTVLGITAARKVLGPLIEKGSDVIGAGVAAAKAKAPMAEASMKNAFDIVKTKAAETAATIGTALTTVSDEVMSPERKQQVSDFTNKMLGRTAVAPEEIEREDIHPEVKTALQESPDRLAAINRLTAMTNTEELDPEVRLAATTELSRMLEGNDDTLAEAGQLYDAIEGVEAAAPAATELRRFNEVFTRLREMPQVQKALNYAADLAGKVKQSASGDVANISKMVGIARTAPDKIDPAAANTILEQNENLPPEDAKALAVASVIAATSKRHKVRVATLGRTGKTSDIVSQEIMVEGKGEKLSLIHI